MKRIISIFLTLVLLLSFVSFGTSATGTLIHSDDFSDGFILRNWLTGASKFSWDKVDKCIQGYGDAIVLETNYTSKYNKCWDKFYASMDFQIRGFDNIHPASEGRPQTVSMWYRDLMENGENGGQSGAIYMYTIEIETGKVFLHKYHEFSYHDVNGVKQNGKVDANIAEGQLEGAIEVGEAAPWYNFGIRVLDGKIECYFNEELVLSSSVEDGTEKLGDVSLDSVDVSVGSQKSAVLFFNGGGHLGPEYYHLGATNWLAFDNFEVWTPEYDGPTPVVYGDVNSDTKVTIADATKMLQHIAQWEVADFNQAAADVTGDNNVNLTDVTRVLQYVAGWDVVLGPTA